MKGTDGNHYCDLCGVILLNGINANTAISAGVIDGKTIREICDECSSDYVRNVAKKIIILETERNVCYES